MQIQKWIATGLSALMAGVSVSAPVLAGLEDFPGNLATTTTSSSALDAFVIMGQNANALDVAGAVDVAVRLAELSFTITAVPGTSGGGINGVVKPNIGLAARLDTQLPNPVKNIHFTGLKDSTFNWRSTSYDYSEQVALGDTTMGHDFSVDKVNGTETMTVNSGQIAYEYVFDQQLVGTGSDTTFNYTSPVDIDLLGEKFSIIGVGNNRVAMLSGVVGTAIREGTSNTGITTSDGAYTVNILRASDGAWADFEVVDTSTGDVVDALITVTGEGQVENAPNSKLDIRTIDIRVVGTDPATQYIAVKVVVGGAGETQKTYTTTCDVSSTGTSSTKFPGETLWCIQVSGFGGTSGTISSTDKIQVVYKPGVVNYFKIGDDPLKLPNDYGEIGLLGFNVDKFVTITVSQEDIGSIYFNNRSTLLPGVTAARAIHLSADVSGSLVDPNTGTGYTDAYLIFNASLGAGDGNGLTADHPVMMAFKNPSDGKVFIPVTTTANSAYYKQLWTNTSVEGQFNYTMNVSYAGAAAIADQQLIYMNVSAGAANIINDFTIGTGNSLTAPADVIQPAYQNKTTWDSKTAGPQFRLGAGTTGQEADVLAETGGDTATDQIGKAQQDIVTDSGAIVVSPGSNSGSQIVKIKVASEDLQVKAYVGKSGDVSTASETYNAVAPIKTAVGKLDSEAGVGSSVRDSNLVLIGGSCANSLVQELVDAGKIPAEFTCEGGSPGSGWEADTGYAWAIDDAFTTGKVAYVGAGTDADDTRLVASVFQNYDHSNVAGSLTGSGVKISGVDVATATIEAA